jgi:hypothetical protein
VKIGIIDFRGLRAILAPSEVALHRSKTLISGLFKQPLRVPEPRPPSCGETTDGGHGPQWQWDPRYGPCFEGQSDDRHQHPEKKDAGLQQVNEGLLQRLDAEQVQVIVHKVAAAEVDEMWSFVGSKRQQRWLWHAIGAP